MDFHGTYTSVEAFHPFFVTSMKRVFTFNLRDLDDYRRFESVLCAVARATPDLRTAHRPLRPLALIGDIRLRHRDMLSCQILESVELTSLVRCRLSVGRVG